MRLEDATSITTRCFHGEPASCSHPCPFFFDVRTFLQRAKDGKWNLAYKLLRNAVVFPGIVCKICPAPCVSECQRADIGDDAIDIRAIEDASVRLAKNKKPESYRIPPKEKSIAVIGANLPGLAAALGLAQKHYDVTVFRCGAEDEDFRSEFQEEIDLQFSSVEISWEDGAGMTDDDDRLSDFDAVLMSHGSGSFNGQETAERPVAMTHQGVFHCGGIDPMADLAAGIAIANDIEAWLLTKGATDSGSENAVRPESHHITHEGVEKAPRIIAASQKGYTSEEAMAEASRCMFCDCRKCFEVCEMLDAFGKRPQKIAVEAYADTKSAPPFATCSLTRETYSCNFCSKCKEVCPVGIDLRELFSLAREGRAATGKHPKAYHDYWLRDFDWHRGEGAYSVIPEKRQAETSYVFFPGCKLGERSPGHVEKAAALLKEKYGAGIMLDCCGVPAYWAGEEVLFAEHLAEIKSFWEEANEPTFVFACAYCLRVFAERLPEISAVSIYELLSENEMPDEVGSVTTAAMSVFDPCAATNFPATREAVRRLASKLEIETTELPDTEAFRCCGFGGHMRLANPPLYETITANRAAASAEKYLVYCANCANAFDIDGKEAVHILDYIFGKPEAGNGAGLWAGKRNAVSAKDALMQIYERKPFVPESKPWDAICLTIPRELLSDMDKRLLTEDDIKQAIYYAEESGDRFLLPPDLYQCSFVGPVITTWVQYKSGSDDPLDYLIVDAWNHRMRIEEDV